MKTLYSFEELVVLKEEPKSKRPRVIRATVYSKTELIEMGDTEYLAKKLKRVQFENEIVHYRITPVGVTQITEEQKLRESIFAPKDWVYLSGPRWECRKLINNLKTK